MTSSHNAQYGLSNARPRHHLDSASWRAWPENPDVIVQHGDLLFKWTADYTSNNQTILVTKLFSEDGGETWQEDTFTRTYRWAGSPEKGDIEAKLDEAIEFAKSSEQKRKNREKARERTAKLKKQADREGITLSELREQISKRRKQENPHKVSKKDIEQLQRKIAVGGLLKELKDEISQVMGKLDTNQIRITHTERYTIRLKEAVRVLKDWQK